MYEHPPGCQAEVMARMREAPAEPEGLGIPFHSCAQQSCSSVPCSLQHWLLCPAVCVEVPEHSQRASKSLQFASRLFMGMDKFTKKIHKGLQLSAALSKPRDTARCLRAGELSCV